MKKMTCFVKELAITFFILAAMTGAFRSSLFSQTYDFFFPYASILIDDDYTSDVVAIGDVNGDGLKDVVAACYVFASGTAIDKIFVYIQDGSSHALNPPVAYDINNSTSPASSQLLIVDINGDGFNDVVVCAADGFAVFTHKGGNPLDPLNSAQLYLTTLDDGTTRFTPGNIQAGDFNDDGLNDIAVRNNLEDQILVFHQNGSHTLDGAVRYPANGKLDTNRILLAADFNDDGLTDIIYLDESASPTLDFVVLTQSASGGFNAPYKKSYTFTVFWQSLIQSMEIGDVTGDGRPDLVISQGGNRPYSYISVLANTGGALADPVTYASYDIPNAIAIADINGDGRNDIVVHHTGWDRLGLYLQDGSGALVAEELYVCVENTHETNSLALGDINADGYIDAIQAEGYVGNVGDPNYLCVLYGTNGNVPPALTVIRPNGGENWMAGTVHDITWTSVGAIGDISIYYSTNSGSNWVSLAAGTANDGSFSWTVPAAISENCRVLLYWDSLTYDISDGDFSITEYIDETITVPLAPAGPNSGLISVSYLFTAGGSTSSLGHAVQYNFDWDDGGTSGWLAEGTTNAAHSWAAAGTYNVRAMARCVTHTDIESLWSATHAIVIAGGSTGYYNSPAQRLILPEATWAAAAGGGDWISELQLVDISGGSVVQVYYNTGTSRRGPFTLWNNGGGAAGSSVQFSNILQAVDGLDGGAFTYYGSGGALELVTQDGSHLLQAAVRTCNGNFSRTFPALQDREENTAASGRGLLIPDLCFNGFYRPSVVLFNPSADSVTVEVKVIGSDGAQVGATISRTLAGYQQNAIVDELRTQGYENAKVQIQVTGGTGRVMASGQTASNMSNDPAAHIAVQAGSGYVNSPAQRLILPEATWAAAAGGGDWISELQLVDSSGGSVVQVYYNTGTSRRGPFTLWDNGGGAAGSSVKFSNILQAVDGLDGGAFTYYGSGGALELVTQDGSHLIQAAVRTFNGNFSRTFPGLQDREENTAASGRGLLIPNLCFNGFYRPSVALFNPSADSVTVEVKVIGGDGAQVGATISRTLAGYQQNAIVDELRTQGYENAKVQIQVTGGTGRVMASGQTANNMSNDPAAHIAVQGQ